jgi:hypothetical protein
MSFQGQPVDDLAREGQAPDWAPPAVIGEEAIIESTTVPQATSPAIESNAGDQGEVDLPDPHPEQARGRLQDVAKPRNEMRRVGNGVQR